MPFIQNAAMDDVRHGWHTDAGPDGVLIQIVDPDLDFPAPKRSFFKTFQFKFLDIDSGPQAISQEQAKEITSILRQALAENRNVIVHCVAGVNRSGAVTEAGVAIGFTETAKWRSANMTVKHALFKELGLTYDADEKAPAVRFLW